MQWDTAGQERFRNITISYYRHSHGIIMVYDITDMTTFDSIRSWMAQIKQHAEAGVCIILVGNKCDLENHRVSALRLQPCTTINIIIMCLLIRVHMHCIGCPVFCWGSPCEGVWYPFHGDICSGGS